MADIKYLDKAGLEKVKSILDGLYSSKSHNHNNLYYTETEVNNLLAGKSDTGHTHSYLPLSGGTMSGPITFNDSATAMIKYGTWTNTGLGSYPLPSLGSAGIGIFVRPTKSTDEGGLIITEDTCMIFNSADNSWSFQVHNTDLSQKNFSGTDGQGEISRVFGIQDVGSYVWSRGGYKKDGSSDSYALLGGGGHIALSSFAKASHTHGYWTYNENTIKSVKVNNAGNADTVGDDTITMIPQYNNEINFGGTNTSSAIYFGYRAAGSKSIPTAFIFGGDKGSASITAAGFKKNGSSDSYALLGGGGHIALSSFAEAGHNHDGRYYTESEINDKFTNFTINKLGTDALVHMCSLYATASYNAYKITTNWDKSWTIMPTINIRGYAYGSSQTIDCDIVIYHYDNTPCEYSLTNKGSYPIRVYQAIENNVQVFYISPGEYYGMFNVFVYGGLNTSRFSDWTMTTVDAVSGTEIPKKEIATSITGNAATANYATSAGSAPASDVYSWAKASTKPSYNFSEINPGIATIGDGANRLMFRTHESYRSGMYYSTPGNEALVFGNKNSVTSWIFATTDPNSQTAWNSLTPSLQIKNGRVTINKLISDSTNADYNLDINGSANAISLYENGIRVALSGHTHTKSQITDFPSSLPANGGNADTVDNKHAADFLQYITQNATFSSVANISTDLTPGIHKIHISGIEYSSILTGKDFKGSYWQMYFHPSDGYIEDIKYRATNCTSWKTLLDSNNYTTYCNLSTIGAAPVSHTHTKSQITDFPSALPANGGNADTVDGFHVSKSNKPWGTIPAINESGWMDVGKHFEFHFDNTTGSDYSTALMCTGNYANVVNLPSASGTLALLTDNVASATNASKLNGYSDSAYFAYRGWDTTPGKDADAAMTSVMGSNFSYSNNCPNTGPLLTFNCGGYNLQLNGGYSSNSGKNLSFRLRNGDAGVNHPWYTICHSGNINSYALPLTGGDLIGKTAIIGQSIGASTISADLDALVIANKQTRANTAGYYYPGIAFNHMYNWDTGKTYQNSPQAWMGLKLHSTPGSELSYLVFGTKESTGATDRPIERMSIAPNGNVNIKKSLSVDGSITSNGSNVLTSITSQMVINALGYTPYNSTNPNGYITSSGSITGSSGSCTGNAATATVASTVSVTACNSSSNSKKWNEHAVDTLKLKVWDVYNDGGPSTYGNILEINGINDHWKPQIWFDAYTGQMRVRNRDYNATKWNDWRTVLDSANYTSYTVKKDGTGASGTWGINITGSSGSSGSCTGNAATASKLTNLNTADAASSTETKRKVWFSYDDGVTGRPALSDNLTFQSSTNTLFSTNFNGNLIGNASTSGSSNYSLRLMEYYGLDRNHDSTIIKPNELPVGIINQFTNSTGASSSFTWNTIVSMSSYSGGSSSGAGYRAQFLFPNSYSADAYDKGTFYIRYGVDDTWKSWTAVVTAANIGSYASLSSHNHDSTYLKLSGGTMTGTIIHSGLEAAGKRILYGDVRNSGIKYDYQGNECLMISAGTYSNSSIAFYTSNRLSLNDSNGQWSNSSPDIHIKNGKVAINKLIANDSSLSYNLDVDGSANATTLYENGTRVALSGHKHTKSQITDFPTSLPANGGNADTVDNLHESSFYVQGRGTVNAQVDLQTIPKDISGGYMVTNSGWTGMVAVLGQGHNASNRAIGFLFKGGQSNRINLLTQVDNTWGDRGVIAYTSDIPTSLPASDVYSWAKASSKPSYNFGEISAGVATIGDGANRLMFRTNASYKNGIYYSTPGNEALVFGTINPVTSWIFATTDPTSQTDWRNLTPSMQIKNGKVAINKLIANGAEATYNLEVNGNINASSGFFDTSDERLKDFYDDIEIDFEKLKSIPKKYFSWKDDENKELQLGTSAQKVQEVYPEIVNSDNEGNLSVSYNKLAIVSLAAVDKLYDENQELKSKIIKMEESMKMLNERLSKIESFIENHNI